MKLINIIEELAGDGYILNERLPLSIAKIYSRNWNKRRLAGWFDGQYRIYIPFNYRISRRRKGDIQKSVESALRSNGYIVTDYIKGLASKPDSKNQFKIGKLLNRLYHSDILKQFNNDPARTGGQQVNRKLLIVISRHPYDIAGMSTDRGWNSCMNLDGGCNREFVRNETKKSIVAYVIYNSDRNIEVPLGRILMKPFALINDRRKKYFIASEQIYATGMSEGMMNAFKKKINQWLKEKQPEFVSGQYELTRDLESSGFRRKINLFNKEDFITGKSRVTTKQAIDDYFWKKFTPDEVYQILEKQKTFVSDLNLSNVKIKELPPGITVKGDLFIENCPIKELPNAMTVKGSIRADNSKLEKLPPWAKTINGDLDIDRTNITRLLPDMTVKGAAYISRTKIKIIPRNFTVGGEFDISDTQVERIMSGLTVEDELILNKKVKTLPPKINVRSIILDKDCSVKRIPRQMIVGTLRIEGNWNGVRKIPPDIRVKTLILHKHRFDIPKTAKIERIVDYSGVIV